jgi:hypothetical protein
MISVFVLIFVSFFLDLFIGNVFYGFVPLFIVCIIPFMSFVSSRYRLFLFLVIGFLMDVLFSDVLFINTIFFFIMYFIRFKKGILYMIFSCLFVYVFYIFYLFVILSFLGYGFYFSKLFSFTWYSFVINVFYIVLCCLIFGRNLDDKKSLY